MKMFRFILPAALACTIFTACDKDENPYIPNNPVGVDSGRSSIGFGATPSYYGTSAFNVFNTTSTYAFSQTSNGVRQVQVKAVDSSGNDIRTVFLFMVMPQTANTTSGSITIDFTNPPSDPYTAKLTLSHRVNSILSRDYNSVSGNVVINTLTDVDVSGSFQGVVADSLGNTLTISGGTFAGRF